MGDDALSGAGTAISLVPPDGAAPALAGRAAKLAAAREGLSKIAAASAPAEAPPSSSGTPTPEAAATSPKADEPAPDPSTARGLEAIDKREARAREREKAAKAEIEAERLEVARLRADIEAKSKAPDPYEALKKLPVKDRYRAALKLAEIDVDNEEHAELVARDSYARSKSGKADPKNKQYAEQVAEKQNLQSELAELRAALDEVRGEFKTRDERGAVENFQRTYLDAAVKAIPAEPTFIGKAHAANPTRARGELLALGQHMERELGETPSHAEVIAEYEKRRRSDLTDAGLSKADIDALLKPAVAAKPAPAPTRTLDPDARPTTTPINGNPTRDQKLALARKGLRERLAETT